MTVPANIDGELSGILAGGGAQTFDDVLSQHAPLMHATSGAIETGFGDVGWYTGAVRGSRRRPSRSALLHRASPP